MTELLDTEAKTGDYLCVGEDELVSSVNFARKVHTVICIFLFYIELHGPIWLRIVTYCRENKICCYRGRINETKILDDE